MMILIKNVLLNTFGDKCLFRFLAYKESFDSWTNSLLIVFF